MSQLKTDSCHLHKTFGALLDIFIVLKSSAVQNYYFIEINYVFHIEYIRRFVK